MAWKGYEDGESGIEEIRILRGLLTRLLETMGHHPKCTFGACSCGAVKKQRDAGLAASKHLRGDQATIPSDQDWLDRQKERE
jgi:hypothetical protein